MFIAIQYKKLNLSDNDILFVPTNLLEGKVNNDGVFEDYNGILYESLDDLSMDNGKYFFNLALLDELKNEPGCRGLSTDQIKKGYFQNLYQIYYALSYNESMGEYNLYDFKFNDIASMYQISIDFDNNGNTTFSIPNNLLIDGTTINLSPEEVGTDVVNDEANTPQNIDLIELRSTVNKSIICQDKAINDITRTIVLNNTSNNPKNKSHILIVGPTGTGKTEIMNIISKQLGVPIFAADATAYTKEGYVGKSVYSMLEGLINAANGDVEKAQNGILIIDEIDKKVSEKSDASGDAVLFSLLKIMDRSQIEVPMGDSFSTYNVNFDTSNLTIVFMGAFQDLYKKKINAYKSIGFNNSTEKKSMLDIKLTNEDFISYGVPSEFIGRIGKITYTVALTEEDLIKIMKESDISQLRLVKEYLSERDIEIEFDDSYIKAIAAKTIKFGTGARGLKNTIGSTLDDVYDLVLTNQKVKKITLTKDTVEDSRKFSVL